MEASRSNAIEQAALHLSRRQTSAVPELWSLLDTVTDPEIPVVPIWDLGILQDISVIQDTVTVTITPTYSGCPAMHEISNDIKTALHKAGHRNVEVRSRLSPAWSTDWITRAGKDKLRAFGIAPPAPRSNNIICPQCGSKQTTMLSEFGSTACKALYKCESCLEPFDYFKCI